MSFLEFLIHLWEVCGLVAIPLALCLFILWYAIGIRFFALRTGIKIPSSKQNPTDFDEFIQIRMNSEDYTWNDENALDSPFSKGFKTLFSLKDKSQKISQLQVEDALYPALNELKEGNQLLKSVVVVAPLLGLLGTVGGMIETFSSLGEMSLFTQGGGIAQGVSQALITTQVGLVVAIPGLLLQKIFDRKEQLRIADLVCLSERLISSSSQNSILVANQGNLHAN